MSMEGPLNYSPNAAAAATRAELARRGLLAHLVNYPGAWVVGSLAYLPHLNLESSIKYIDADIMFTDFTQRFSFINDLRGMGYEHEKELISGAKFVKQSDNFDDSVVDVFDAVDETLKYCDERAAIAAFTKGVGFAYNPASGCTIYVERNGWDTLRLNS